MKIQNYLKKCHFLFQKYSTASQNLIPSFLLDLFALILELSWLIKLLIEGTSAIFETYVKWKEIKLDISTEIIINF